MSDHTTLSAEEIGQAKRTHVCAQCLVEQERPDTPHACLAADGQTTPFTAVYKCPDCSVTLRFPDPDGSIGECPSCGNRFHK